MEERKKKWRMIWVGSGIQFWKCCIFLLICRGPDPATVPMEMQNELENDVPRWISTSQKQLYAVCERRKGPLEGCWRAVPHRDVCCGFTFSASSKHWTWSHKTIFVKLWNCIIFNIYLPLITISSKWAIL